MKKQILAVIILGIIISFATGLFIGWLIPLNIIPSTGEQIVRGDRSHLIGSWKGPVGKTTFSVPFFENGSFLFSTLKGTYTVTQDQLVLHAQGASISAQYFFIGDYNTLGLRNLQGNTSFTFSFFGTPYGIILQRA